MKVYKIKRKQENLQKKGAGGDNDMSFLLLSLTQFVLVKK